MYDLSLPLCHAFVKCFILVFKSIGFRKTFHENISYCPQCRGVIFSLGFCIEKEFVQPMLNFFRCDNNKTCTVGINAKMIVVRSMQKRKKSMAKLCFIDLGAYIKHNIFLQSQNSQVELGLLHPF